MASYVALLRAINVGGSGTLPMAELKAICVATGLARVRTYIASGNVVFESAQPVATIKAAIEARLHADAGKPIGVTLRSAAEMAAVLAGNPFGEAPPNRCFAVFLDEPPPADALEGARGRVDEELRLGRREIYVRCPTGIGRSKLRIPAAQAGTARNMNTVAKLAELAAAYG
ncbi:DUF1697 domain-containing protein [Roseomonas eburnea]|uniref:DUF1697 domain-containing protein n=1 Tax=Neoroseomonas eburnea TaxID=1346889 RepID=A0A9X9XIA4_9PROT|nr:DUF1697 domain-containing protein [Neoroseomonas eburnea]MBR0683440.1 DUF1697 domain-containing protein [Neoroseomonas eburnea]